MRKARVEVVFRVFVIAVFLEFQLRRGGQKSLHAHLALDVHRLGVASELRA